jgi:hypothetical protein
LPVPKIQKDYGSEALAIAETVTAVPAGVGFMAYRRKEAHGAALGPIYSSATERPPSGGIFVWRVTRSH